MNKAKTIRAKDSAGNVVLVELWTGTKASSGYVFSALDKLQLPNGEAVNWISKGKYKTVIGERELTSDDPNDP